MSIRLYILTLIIVVGFQEAYSQYFDWVSAIRCENNYFYRSCTSSDSLGNIYFAGNFAGEMDLDPSSDSFIVTGGADIGSTGLFWVKFDKNGNFINGNSIVSTDFIFPTSIDIDIDGNVYLTGIFQGDIDLNTGTENVSYGSVGLRDIFILKLDQQGNYVWSKTIGGSGDDMGTDILISKNKEVYVIGHFFDTLYYDNGLDTSFLVSAGSYDIFLIKLDEQGNYQWIKNYGNEWHDHGNSIAIDSNNDLFFTGNFFNSINFDDSNNENTLFSSGLGSGMAGYICKITSEGEYVWSKSMPAETSLIENTNIEIDNNGNVFVSGTFAEKVIYDITNNIDTLRSNGGNDIFILKVSNEGKYLWSKSFGSRNHDFSDGIDIDEFGNLYLTATYKDSLFINGEEISSKNHSNEDIVILKMNGEGGYTWVKTLESQSTERAHGIDVDEIGNVVIIGWSLNQLLDFDPNEGVTYADYDNPQYSGGVFVLKLTPCNIDTNIIFSNEMLMSSHESESASYQWVKCANMTKIIGANNKSFKPTEVGSYAVVISDIFCSELTECFFVSDLFGEDSWSILPNPTTDQINISTEEEGSIFLIDDLGKTILMLDLMVGLNTIDVSYLSNGVYVIRFESSKGANVKRLIKM